MSWFSFTGALRNAFGVPLDPHVPEIDLEEDPKEDPKEDLKEDPEEDP